MRGFKKFEEQIEKDVPNTVNSLKNLFGLNTKKKIVTAPQTLEAKPILKEYEVKQLGSVNHKCKICKDTQKVNSAGKTITCPYCRGMK